MSLAAGTCPTWVRVRFVGVERETAPSPQSVDSEDNCSS
ncbi:hypothetical protein NJ7G_1364 [Natrinema sp. J7-2]|nr:hypothetical protein NJ7G_1364 [Natrinema sp. J7-2]